MRRKRNRKNSKNMTPENAEKSPVLSLQSFIPKDGATRTVDVEFKGMTFTVRYINRTRLLTIAQSCTILAYDPTTRGKTPKLDHGKLTRALAEVLVAGWSRVTLRNLQRAMMLENLNGLTADQLDEPIPFNLEALEAVLANANGLDEFLQETATDADNFKQIPREDAVKN